MFTPVGDSAMRVTGMVTGLPGNKSVGVHVHEKGNLGNGCMAAGGHWNPFNSTHGGHNSTVRHPGDLGNLNTDGSGQMVFNLTIPVDPGDPSNGFTGLALVIHNNTDDLGLKDNPGSKATGNSGARVTCAVIGLAEPPRSQSNKITAQNRWILSSLFLLRSMLSSWK